MVSLTVPSSLRGLIPDDGADRRRTISLEASSWQEMRSELTRRYPKLARRILSESGDVFPAFALVINDDLGLPITGIATGDSIDILAVIAGGATTLPPTEQGTTDTRQGLRPPGSWRNPATHYLTVMDDPWYHFIVELHDAFARLTAEFWSRKGVTTLNLPLTTGSISSPSGLGSDSQPVRVEIAGVPTYLADSMQFMLEFGCRLSPAGCYYIMPSFRGETSDATHLPQFLHSEAEIPGGLMEVRACIEEYIRFLCDGLLVEHRAALRSNCGDVRHIEDACNRDTFPVVTFQEAARLLQDDPAFVFQGPEGWRTLTRQGELRLIEEFGGFVWVIHMDHLAVPFYQAFADDSRQYASNGDLLFGIGETVGCGERHTSHEELRDALRLHQLPESDYAWYVEMKKRRPMHTSGFGMGVERFLLWVLQHDDIRDVPLVLRFEGQNIAP